MGDAERDALGRRLAELLNGHNGWWDRPEMAPERTREHYRTAAETLGREAVERHQSQPDPADADGWIRRSALNHWCERATTAERERDEARAALASLLAYAEKYAAEFTGDTDPWPPAITAARAALGAKEDGDG